MKTRYRATLLALGLLTSPLWSLCGQEFFPALETPTNFSGVGNIFLMTEVSSEGADLYSGDSWDIKIWLSGGVTSLTNAFAVVGPLEFQHHALGLEPSTIIVPAQPPISFLPFTEPQWFEFSRSGPMPGDLFAGIPDFTYSVSGTVAYDGRSWFSWHPTVELQVVPEAPAYAILALGIALLVARRKIAG